MALAGKPAKPAKPAKLGVRVLREAATAAERAGAGIAPPRWALAPGEKSMRGSYLAPLSFQQAMAAHLGVREDAVPLLFVYEQHKLAQERADAIAASGMRVVFSVPGHGLELDSDEEGSDKPRGLVIEAPLSATVNELGAAVCKAWKWAAARRFGFTLFSPDGAMVLYATGSVEGDALYGDSDGWNPPRALRSRTLADFGVREGSSIHFSFGDSEFRMVAGRPEKAKTPASFYYDPTGGVRTVAMMGRAPAFMEPDSEDDEFFYDGDYDSDW